jgi:hypothetical protein
LGNGLMYGRGLIAWNFWFWIQTLNIQLWFSGDYAEIIHSSSDLVLI